MLQHDWSDGCLFINPDEIAKYEFGDWNSPEAVMKAVVRAQELREECLRTGRRNPRILFRTRDGEVFKEYLDMKHHNWAQMMREEMAGQEKSAT